ncbi:MAG: TIM-barrel domain-containing protein [Thermocladium sp.]
MATFEGMAKSGKEPFILSRAGYAGIQRYAFVWTADGTPSWDQLRLQLQLVLGLSVSGVPYVGIDIGGFQGRGSPLIDNSTELLLRYYQAAMFFPLYRTHKATDGIDTEPIYLPKHYKERVREAINLRYTFMSYMYNLVIEAHLHGHPIVRPLFYEFQDDEDMYRIDDEYMVGRHVLFAPILYPQTNDRSVILPRGDWMDFWTKKRVSGVVRSSSDVPIYIRTNSIVLLDNGDLIVTGQGGETYGDIVINADQNGVILSKQTRINKLIILGSHNKAYVDGKMVDASIDGDATMININGAVTAVRVE